MKNKKTNKNVLTDKKIVDIIDLTIEIGVDGMTNTEELITTLKVVKRNGKKVDFDGTKIALAIKKGFDSVEEDL